uniref:CSON014074 protein n=1 Tax=Culicoides sonorensis TaxID=179676 RepID=A0A336KRC5_CULSO
MELSSEIHKKDNKVVRKPMKITIVKKKGSGKHSLCSNSVSLSFRSRINNLTQVKNTSTAQNNQTQHKRSHSFNQQTPYSQSQIQSPNKVGPTNGLNILGRDRSKAKANWTITNLHPPPPIMPSFTQSTGSSTAASLISILNKSGGGGAALTYEEDALILRVIESYSAAYQSNSRNTMHAALQPFTPVLPIRGGKLRATKSFSSSNPQLPFTCGSLSAYLSSNNNHTSSNSINSSHIWREATPNNFNMYSASISSLNTSYRSRNSIMDCYNTNTNTSKTFWRTRAASEERPTTIKAFETQNNTSTSAGTPLLGRKVKQVKIKKFATNLQSMNQVHQQIDHPGLYDRKLNRSFEKPEGFVKKDYQVDDYYGAGSGQTNSNNNRNSSPLHLENDDHPPTLKQIWQTVKLMQKDIKQMKVIVAEERALRCNLQELLMTYLEKGSNHKTTGFKSNVTLKINVLVQNKKKYRECRQEKYYKALDRQCIILLN